jgi:uncharacterized protein
MAFPFSIDSRGRTEAANENRHLRDMIEMVLFTVPGERVMRPDFGCGLLQLVFVGNGPELAGATQALVQASLQKWLGDRLRVEAVQVTAQDSTLQVTVQYSVLQTGQRETALFRRTA